ncbi:hypothetical protein QA089_000974 [Meyerozyma guilliermondii]
MADKHNEWTRLQRQYCGKSKRFSASGADRSRQHYHCRLRIEEIRVHSGSCAGHKTSRKYFHEVIVADQTDVDQTPEPKK